MSIFEAYNRLYPFYGHEDNWNKAFDNKYLNAAAHVWNTEDYTGAAELLWRWWNFGVITPHDVLKFAQFVENNTEDTSCDLCISQMKKHANELIAEERKEKITN